MFVAIYSFEVRAGKDEQFIKAWEEFTKLIYQFEGSLGSRLHKKGEQEYTAYAQWPDKKTWENSGKNLPESANEHRALMKEACVKIDTSHELEMISDLLKSKTNV
jgi:heme-degrading monooxygenase HmoA